MSALPVRATARRIRAGRAARQCARSHFAALAAVLALLPGAAGAEWHGEAIDLMGTRVSVELWHEDEAAARELVTQVLDEYRRIDRAMSTYKPDSEISRLNASAADAPFATGEELFTLIRRSIEISEASGGAFDITYESVGHLYDFRERHHPTGAQVSAALPAVDYRHLLLDDAARTVEFAAPGVRINLGGIAKGHAVERGAAILRAAGVEHAVLNAGGDTRVLGDRRGKPWIIGIRHPRVDGEYVTRLPIVDEAVSTSGDYERFFEEGGKRYHHIINPSTGLPTEGVLSVTVIGPDATITDGLSTTLFVLGREKGLEVIEKFSGYEAIIVESDGRMSYSSGLTAPE